MPYYSASRFAVPQPLHPQGELMRARQSSVIIGFAFLLLLTGCPSKPSGDEKIAIGFAGPLTGKQANYGTMSFRGAELRLAEINAEAQKNGGSQYTLLRGEYQAT